MYPRFFGSTNTIPHLDTVAGEAYCRSNTCQKKKHMGKSLGVIFPKAQHIKFNKWIPACDLCHFRCNILLCHCCNCYDKYICLSWPPQVQFENKDVSILPTSNRRAQCFCRRIRSPFAKVKRRLSSITEFMFSTHRASTSPSNTMYLFSFLSVGLLISLQLKKEKRRIY